MDLAHPAQTKFVICDYAIENSLHWRLDVTLREDASQVRTGQAPEILVLLNLAVLALLDGQQVSNVAAQRRRFAAYPAQALRLVLAEL